MSTIGVHSFLIHDITILFLLDVDTVRIDDFRSVLVHCNHTVCTYILGFEFMQVTVTVLINVNGEGLIRIVSVKVDECLMSSRNHIGHITAHGLELPDMMFGINRGNPRLSRRAQQQG